MNPSMPRWLCVVLAGLLIVLQVAQLTTLAPTSVHAADAPFRLPSFSQDGRSVDWMLTDSRFGYVARYSLALARELDGCVDADPSLAAVLRIAPHRVTSTTLDAVRKLIECKPPTSGAQALPFERIAALDTGRPPPTVMERARALALRASPLTPDYDRTFWDLTGDGHRRSVDPDSLFTWGPWRATAGHGCTLQRVLKRLNDDAEVRPLLSDAFEGEAPLLEGLLAKNGCTRAKALLLPLTQDAKRAETLQFALARLATSPRVRAIYDDVFYGRGGVRLAVVEKYAHAWNVAGRNITEVDAAFFLMRSLQYARLPLEQVQRFAKEAAAARAPWEVRQIASRVLNYTASGTRSFQVGYDVGFYIDGADSRLPREDIDAWVTQSRLKASDVGLQDQPIDICTVFPLRTCPEVKR